MGHSNSKRLLELTAQSREHEAIELLEDSFAIDTNYTNIHGETALHLACANNLENLVVKLIENDSNVNLLNAFNSSPLHISVRNANLNICEILLKLGKCDTNILSSSNFSGLTIACSIPHLGIVRLLLSNGAFIQDKTLLIATSITVSKIEIQMELIHILLSNGANINSRDKYGNTALMQCCARNNISIVKLLLSNKYLNSKSNLKNNCQKINVNIQNQYGWTALHFAYGTNIGTSKDRNDIISLLITNGALIDVKNDSGRTPIQLKNSSSSSSSVNELDYFDQLTSNRPLKRRKLENGQEIVTSNPRRVNLLQQFESLNDTSILDSNEKIIENKISPKKTNSKNSSKKGRKRKRGE